MSISITAYLLIFLLLANQNRYVKWGIKICTFRNDRPHSTCAHHCPHTKFHQCSPCIHNPRYLIFLLLANQNRYENEVSNMYIWWRQTTPWVEIVPITTHIPSFINVAHTELWIFDFFVISQSEQLHICTFGDDIPRMISEFEFKNWSQISRMYIQEKKMHVTLHEHEFDYDSCLHCRKTVSWWWSFDLFLKIMVKSNFKIWLL